MAIDKTIRIQDLPPSILLNNDNLVIINDSDNITRSITFEDFIGSITGFPDGINIGPSEGIPGLSFCPEDNTDCGTGIGSSGDCQLTVYTCRQPIINIGPSPDGGRVVDVSGNVEIENNLTVRDDTILSGSVNIGQNCNPTYKLVVDSPTYLNCETFAIADVTIGTECTHQLVVNSTSTFNCTTEFNGDVTVSPGFDITIEGGDLNINGSIKPPAGGILNINVNNANFDGDVNIGVLGSNCEKDLVISNKTQIWCNTKVGTGITMYPEGDASNNIPSGTVESNFFKGDGSLLENLNLPGSVTFSGNIDVTAVAPTSPQVGDLYVNSKKGNANSSFDGLNQEEVELNQFVYYYTDPSAPLVNGLPVNKWGKGSVQDDDGFVTLSTPQNITGEKTFDAITRSLTPDGTILNEVVNVKYLSDELINNNSGLEGEYVTLNTDQTSTNLKPITGDKDFTGLVTAVSPPVINANPKQVVTVDYLTSGGFLSVWNQTGDVIEPTADSVTTIVKTKGVVEGGNGILFYGAPTLV